MRETPMRAADEDLWHAYSRDLRARNLSADTVENYRRTMQKLSAALGPAGLGGVTARQLQSWFAAIAADPAYSAGSLATYFRRIRTFYSWAARMEYLDGPSPMARLKQPREESRVIPVPEIGALAAVVAACKGKDFRDRRDLAMIRLMLETGTPRASALAGLQLTGVDLRRDTVTVMDKGRKERVIPVGAKTAHALTLYLRARAAHPRASCPELFIGTRGTMTRDGIYQVVAYRCEIAGVPVISPHKWRHYSAHAWFAAGGSEADAMQLFGWSKADMAHRYGRAAAASRAQDHARAAALADRI